MMLRKRVAISVSASAHVISSKRPSPLAPMRRSGRRIRSGLYTRSRKRFTFGHSSPLLNGCSGLPRNCTACAVAPVPSTVTCHPQLSGQSWWQVPWTMRVSLMFVNDM